MIGSNLQLRHGEQNIITRTPSLFLLATSSSHTKHSPNPSLYDHNHSTVTQYNLPFMYNNYFSTQASPATPHTPSHNCDFNNTVSRDWQMYQGQNSGINGGVSALQNSGLFRGNRGHQRNVSESTINSTGPSSPYTQTAAYPFIANPERSPNSSQFFDDSSNSYQKTVATPTQAPFNEQFQQYSNVGYMPSQLSHTPAAHLAMKNLGIDHHNSTEEVPEFSHSSRQSVSSRGQDSPSTPLMGSSDEQEERPGLYKTASNGETSAAADLLDAYLYADYLADYRGTAAPRVELFRTESAACADELYNPENFSQQPSSSSLARPVPDNTNFHSPSRNQVNERIRTAYSIRSQSPAHAQTRDRSPFRTGSPLAPNPSAFLATAADSRRQQKEESYARELGQHQPKLKREQTKTMSPKDALLDYNEADQDMPLFPDAIPAGYQKHYGGTEAFMNNFISGTNQTMGNIAASAQPNMAGFRASTADGSGNTDFNFLQPTNPYTAPQYRSTNFSTDPTPDFPAHLTSMESSISDAGAPASSQGSSTSAIQRPLDTKAHTGTYTCVFSGCSQRFESSIQLQKHKRDAHASARDSYSSAPATSPEASDGSASPGSGDSMGSGMTSAALAARNSQQGPHKCTRINPSTGKPCNTIFSRPYDLTRHEDTIHNRGKQKVRCQYCREEKSFSRSDALTRHMRVVHPEVDWQQGTKRGRKGDAF